VGSQLNGSPRRTDGLALKTKVWASAGSHGSLLAIGADGSDLLESPLGHSEGGTGLVNLG
jgi:hypothetical protein